MVSKTIVPASQSALIVGLIITLTSALITGLLVQIAQPELPLLYTRAQSAASLIKKEWLFIIPALILILEIINLIFVVWFKTLSSLLLVVFSWVLVASQILLLLALLRILWITS